MLAVVGADRAAGAATSGSSRSARRSASTSSRSGPSVSTTRAPGAPRQPHRVPALRPRPRPATASRSSSSASGPRCRAAPPPSRCGPGRRCSRPRSTFVLAATTTRSVRPPVPVERGPVARRHRPHHAAARRRVRGADPGGARAMAPDATELAERPRRGEHVRVVMTCRTRSRDPAACRVRCSGLARELRRLGVDVRVLAPCDGPPPEPGVVSRRAERRVELERLGRADRTRRGRSRARARPKRCARIEPDLVHLHEPAVPGPCLSSLIGFDGPMVGTFHASGELLHHVDAAGVASA